MDATLMETLQSRLNLKQLERDQKREYVRNIDSQISRMLRSAPKRPRHSVDVLKQMISDLEMKRSTTSMSLSKEKDLIRDIRELKGKIREHNEKDNLQNQIQEMKETKQRAQDQVVEIGKQIAELEGALGRLEIRGKLFMMGVDIPIQLIMERTLGIRREDVSFVANLLEEMEKRHSVSLELDRDNNRVHVAGTKEGVAFASAEIEKIASATIQKVPLLNTKARILAYNRDDLLNFALQHDVMANIEARHVMLRGQSESVEIVLKHIEALTSNEIKIDLKTKGIVGIVIGKKGATILEMEKKHGVVCNVTDSPVTQLEILGPKDKIEMCAKEFRELIRENTYTEERFDVEMDSFLAQDIRNSKMFRNVAKNNRCFFSLKYDDTTDQPYVLIGGTPKNIQSGRDELKDTIKKWHCLNTRVQVSENCMSLVYGKSKFMDNLRSLVKPCNVLVSYDTKELVIQGTEENKVEEMTKTVKENVQDLRCVRMKLNKSVVSFVIGKKGSKITEIKKKSKFAQIRLNNHESELEILGPSESVEIAKRLVNEVVEENFVDTVNVPTDSFLGSFIGKKGETLKKFAKNFDVEVKIPKDRNKEVSCVDVTIRGNRDKVKSAVEDIKSQLEKYRLEHRQIAVHKSCLPDLIGQGGERINSIQKECGVRVNVNFQTGIVSIRGTEENMNAAEKRIVEIVGDLASWKPNEEEPCCDVVVNVKTNLVRHVVGSNASVMNRIQKDYDVIVAIRRGKRGRKKSEDGTEFEKVTIIGKHLSNVNRAKEAIETILDDVERFKKTITVKRTPFVAVFGETYSGLQNLRDLSSSLNFVVKESIKSKNVLDVTIEGTRKGYQIACEAVEAANRRKNTTFIRLIREHLPSLKSSERNLSKISSDTKCKITLDDRTCCVVIVGAVKMTVQAEKQIHYMLNFLFEGHYGRVVIPESFVPKLLANKASALRDFEQAHADCNPTFKRSDRSICFSSSDKSAVSKAHDSLNEMLLEHQKTNVFIAIPNAEYIGDIIGSKGSKINEIKKELGLSRITVSREDNTIFIAAKDEETIEKAKDIFQSMFERFEKERCVFHVDPQAISVIIGKKGATIQNLTKTTKCRIDVKKTGEIRLRGKESAVNMAKEEIERLVHEQEKRQGEISLERDMIPSVIGKGGSNIRDLQKKFNLRIDVNKDNGVVSFQGPEDMIEMAMSHFRDLKLKFEEEKEKKRIEIESKRHEKQQHQQEMKKHQDAKDSETMSSENVSLTPATNKKMDVPPGFASIPIGMSKSSANGDMYLSKNAKRRLRRNRRRKEEAPSPMELLMGSSGTTNKTLRPADNKPGALTDAMRLLGLGRSSMGISPAHPLEAEEENLCISTRGIDGDGNDTDVADGSYYASSSGYKLRL